MSSSVLITPKRDTTHIRDLLTHVHRLKNGCPLNFASVRLAGEELNLFTAACADVQNIHAQELMNVFGVDNGREVLLQVNHAPIGIFVDMVQHIWYAILHEASRRDARWGEVLERAIG